METMKRIMVLKGGWNGEREVSLNSGHAVATSLARQGYTVKEVTVSKNLADLFSCLSTFKPDVVANCLHGTFGEDGHVQGILEGMGIPHTSSSLLASALAMNKPHAKIMFRTDDLPCTDDRIMPLAMIQQHPPFPFPFIIKPPSGGSSVGVYLISDQKTLDDLSHIDNDILSMPLMVEPYIPGRELSIPVLHGEALGILELQPKEGFYDYAAKYTDGLTTHICPAILDVHMTETLLRQSERAIKVLGCTGLCRVDWRLDDTRTPAQPYILEVNTQPGMTALSIAPEVALLAKGWTFDTLTHYMVENPRIPDPLC